LVHHGFEEAPETERNGVFPDLASALSAAKEHVDSGYACGVDEGYTPAALYTISRTDLWIYDDDGDAYVVVEALHTTPGGE
jgi:hypothetical protein